MNIKRVGNKLLLEVEVAPEAQARLSSTGKSKIAYSSGGFKSAEGLKINFTAIYPQK